MTSWRDQVALVTGAARGIGRATARFLAQRGAAVCVNYAAHADAAEELVAEIIAAEGRAIAAVADVAEVAAVEAMIAHAEKELGPVTILVNNAGVSWRGTLDTYDPEQVARMRRVNVEGLINTTRTVMKGMRERRYGRIVNVSSIAAIGTALPGKRRSGRSAQCTICGIHRPAPGPSVAPLVPAQAGTRQERPSRRLVASFGSFRPAAVGFDVILRRALDQRHDLILDRFNRGHRGMPLRPVPFDQRDAAMPIVIGAA